MFTVHPQLLILGRNITGNLEDLENGTEIVGICEEYDGDVLAFLSGDVKGTFRMETVHGLTQRDRAVTLLGF